MSFIDKAQLLSAKRLVKQHLSTLEHGQPTLDQSEVSGLNFMSVIENAKGQPVDEEAIWS